MHSTAYQWQKQRLKEKQEDSISEDIDDSDGGGPDIIEVETPKQEVRFFAPFAIS